MSEKEPPIKLSAANDNPSSLGKFIKENRVAIGAVLTSAACGVYLEVRHGISSHILSLLGQ